MAPRHYLSFFVLSIALIISLIPATTMAQNNPRIGVFPDHGHRGVDIYVYGGDFTPLSTVYIYFDTELIDTSWTDSNGYFSEFAEIPIDARPGIHVVKVVDDNGLQASTVFTVVSPSIQLNTTKATPLDRVHVSGSGYAVYQWYLIAVDGLVVNSFVSGLENESISTTITIPPLPSGVHRVSIIYISLESGKHVVIAEKTIHVENGYIDNETFTKTMDKVWDAINSLSDKITSIDKELETIESTITILKNNVEELSTNLSIVNTTLNKLTTHVWRTISEINTTLNTLSQLVTELRENQTKISIELLGKIHETTTILSEKIQSLNKSLTETIELLSSKPWTSYTDTKISAVKQELETAEKTLTTLQEKLDNLTNQLTTTEKNTKEKITTLENRLEELDQQLDTMNKTIHEQQEEIQRLLKEKTNNLVLGLTLIIIGLAIALGIIGYKLAKLSNRIRDQ